MKLTELRKIAVYCENRREIRQKLVDDELIHYSAKMDKTDGIFNRELQKYFDVTDIIPEGFLASLRGQFMGFTIFKKGGLIKKYLDSGVFSKKSTKEINFLKGFLKKPMKYAFCRLLEKKASDCYLMHDPMLDKEMLVYSPAMTRTMQDLGQEIEFWLLLVNDNGQCFETYGPVIYFQSLSEDDVFFFAICKTSGNEWGEDLGKEFSKDLNIDPVPYLMLSAAMTFEGLEVRGQAAAIITSSTTMLMEFNPEEFEDNFDIAIQDGIYRLGLINLDQWPHFSRAYYDESTRNLEIHAMTLNGYLSLIDTFKNAGIDIDEEPDFILQLYLPGLIQDILGVNGYPSNYVHLFLQDEDILDDEEDEMDEELEEEMTNIETFVSLIVDDLNEGRTPNVKKNAKKANLPIELAAELMKLTKKQFDFLNSIRK